MGAIPEKLDIFSAVRLGLALLADLSVKHFC
jgi:hypothetical protein